MEHQEDLNTKQFANLEAQLTATERQAELTGDEEKMNSVVAIRLAAQSIGLAPTKINHATDNNSKEGGKVALASYNEGNGEYKAVGADRLIEGAENAGLNVREFTKAVLNHEKTHEESRTSQGALQTDQILTHLFGEKAVHNTEEAAASQAEGATKTKKFDTYDQERSETDRYASGLGIGRAELLKIRISGDYRELLKSALTSGLIAQNDNNKQIAA